MPLGFQVSTLLTCRVWGSTSVTWFLQETCLVGLSSLCLLHGSPHGICIRWFAAGYLLCQCSVSGWFLLLPETHLKITPCRVQERAQDLHDFKGCGCARKGTQASQSQCHADLPGRSRNRPASTSVGLTLCIRTLEGQLVCGHLWSSWW